MRVEHHWRVFAIVATAIAMASMDAGMIPILFTGIEATFDGTSPQGLSWVFTAYTIALAAFVVASGRLADRTGRKRVFMIGTAIFVLGSALSGMAPSPQLLILARFVQGTGAALFTPASLGLVLAVWPEHRRTAAIGSWVAVGGLASGVGPTAGAVIVEFSTWRLAFFLNVILGLPLLWKARQLLVETETSSESRIPDPLGIALLTVTLGLLALVTVQGRTWGWSDARLTVAIASALVLATWFWRRSRHHPSPVLDPTLLRSRTYRTSLVISTLLAMAMLANLVMQVQFLEKAWGFSTLRAGLAVTPLPVIAGITAPFAGRLAGRFGHRPVILAGTALTVLGLVAYSVLPGESPNYWTGFFPGLVLAGMGTWGMAISMINAAAVTDMSTENFGVGTAILQTSRQGGGILGIALFFGLFGTPAADEMGRIFADLWLLFAALPALALPLVFRLPRGTGKVHPVAVTPEAAAGGAS